MHEPVDGIAPRPLLPVLLVDDQRLLREGLRTLLELHPGLSVVGEAADGIVAEALVERLKPDVVLMDLRMPRRDGVAATRRISARWPQIPVLVLTTYDDDDLVRGALEAGAAGYLLKDVGSDALAEAIYAAGRGESPLQPRIARKVLGWLRDPPTTGGDAAHMRPVVLTERESEVLALLGTGASNREIAERLSLTEGTIKNYISGVFAKTGLRDRTQAALYAQRRGLRVRGE
ncbi:MAG: response regulator transcription factor [Chloroflexota bacterium]